MARVTTAIGPGMALGKLVESRMRANYRPSSPALTQRSLSFLMVNATPREPPVPLELVRSA